jgi:hypothetical protein
MNDLDSNSLADQVAALRHQVTLLMMALIVVTGTLVAYLSYESHHIGKDVANIQAQIIQPYDKKLPAIRNFVSQLVTYGNAHPEFRPVLEKYGIGTNAVPPKK